eukprot:163663-Amphidinium_carterae.1
MESTHGLTDTLVMPTLGLEGALSAKGMPFVALRQDFVRWLSQARHRRGSDVWLLLRYSMRLFMSIERTLHSLLLNTQWCHYSSFQHSL